MAKITKKKLIQEVPPEHVFWVRDGSVLRNIEEMLYAIERMDDETFRHHVSLERNDFSNWLRDIHMEIELADRLQQILDRENLLEIIRTSIEIPVSRPKSSSGKKKPAKKKAATKKAKPKKRK